MTLKEEEEKIPPWDYLLIACYVIATLEMFQSLMLAFNSIYELSLHQNTNNIVAYLGGVVYVLTVKALIVGLWKRLPTFLLFWLIFSAFGAVTSIILLIWNIMASPVYDKDIFKEWTIVFLRISYECICLFLVYRFYRKLCHYSPLEGENYDCPEMDAEAANQESECECKDEREEDDWKEPIS